MALPFTDTFNRANGAPGANYTNLIGTQLIATNELQGQNDGPASFEVSKYVGDTMPDNQTATITFSDALSSDMRGGACCRLSGTGGTTNGYAVMGEFGTTIYVWKITNGSLSDIATALSQAFVTGDTLTLEVSGTSITVKLNGSTVGGPYTDSSYTSGQTGIITYFVGTVDAFTTDSLAGGGGGGAVSSPFFFRRRRANAA